MTPVTVALMQDQQRQEYQPLNVLPESVSTSVTTLITSEPVRTITVPTPVMVCFALEVVVDNPPDNHLHWIASHAVERPVVTEV